MLKENVVVRLFSRRIFGEAIDFHVDPYYYVLVYLMIILLLRYMSNNDECSQVIYLSFIAVIYRYLKFISLTFCRALF